MNRDPSVPAEPRGDRRHRAPVPPSIRMSIRLVLGLVGLSLVNAILTYVYLDEMATAAAQSQAAGGDVDAIRASLVTVAVADLMGLGIVRIVLAVALRKGAKWARIVLTLLAVVSLSFGVIGLRVGTARPVPFIVTGLVAVVLQSALLYFLWRKDATAFLHREQPT